MEWDKFTSTAVHEIWYMADGSIVEFDLSNPRIPLPRHKSLVVRPTTLARK
jgi:hypothetical protein